MAEEDVILVSDDMAQRLAEDHERDEIVRRAVLALDQPDREIILRYSYYGQKAAEIAAEMDMNAETVKSRLRRGREKLRKMIGEGNLCD